MIMKLSQRNGQSKHMLKSSRVFNIYKIVTWSSHVHMIRRLKYGILEMVSI